MKYRTIKYFLDSKQGGISYESHLIYFIDERGAMLHNAESLLARNEQRKGLIHQEMTILLDSSRRDSSFDRHFFPFPGVLKIYE